MSGQIVIGLRCKLYVDDEGVGEGEWQEVGKIGDVTLAQSRNEVEIKERDVDEVGIVLAQKVRELSFQMTRRPGNAIYDMFRDAFINGTPLGIAVMSGGILVVGSQGYQADMLVTKFDDGQAIEGALVDVALKRDASSATPPADVKVIAGP